MRYLMTFSYNGNYFNGYQRQTNKKTVQGCIEKVLRDLTKEEITINASSRTDCLVHAINQKAHFDSNMKISVTNLKKHLNNNLNNEIYIKNIEQVPSNFHARYSVKSKVYKYYINVGTLNIFQKDYIYQYCEKLDIKKMKKASKYLIGKHDYRAFVTASRKIENCVREITKIDFKKSKDIIEISFYGSGFLRYMIRNIVSILIKIGSNKMDVLEMKKILDSKTKCNIKPSFAGGLYLCDVYY